MYFSPIKRANRNGIFKPELMCFYFINRILIELAKKCNNYNFSYFAVQFLEFLYSVFITSYFNILRYIVC